MWRRVKLDFKKEREVAVFWQKSCKLAAKDLEIQQNAPVKFELTEAVNVGITQLKTMFSHFRSFLLPINVKCWCWDLKTSIHWKINCGAEC